MNDTDDVERGYYVYLHRNRATLAPFYVGKGKGRRAYDVEGRHPDWHEMVNSLAAGFDTEIVKNELTEEESFQLERALIRKYGKISDGTGTLVNVTNGGSLDFGEASVEFGIVLPPEAAEAFRVDYEAKTYRRLRPEERKSLSESIIIKMRQLRARYEKKVVEDQETDFEMEVENLLWGAGQLAEKYAKRKVSSKVFGVELEDLYEDSESHLEDSKGEKPELVVIVKEFRAFIEEKVNDLKGSGIGSR
jgi:hypothetical protein